MKDCIRIPRTRQSSSLLSIVKQPWSCGPGPGSTSGRRGDHGPGLASWPNCPSCRIRRRRRRRCRRPAVAVYHFPKSCGSSDNTQWQPPGCRRSNRIRSTSTTRNPSMSTVLSSYRAEPCAVVPGLQLVLCLSAVTVGGCARRRSTPPYVEKWAEDAQPVSCRVCMYSTPTVSERTPSSSV